MATSFTRLLRDAGRVVTAALSAPSPARRRAATRRSPARPAGEPPSSALTREAPLEEALAHVAFGPVADDDADPGEVVWAWVPYEDDPARGKDRPVVVLGRGGAGVYVAQMTSKDHDLDAAQEARWGRHWLDIGSGPWDSRGRPSEVRVDRALWVPLSAVRREGAALDRGTFERVVAALLAQSARGGTSAG